ncbi:MAG: hypothetical protein J6N19_03640 [Clostridium sp.]|nr:hypothetical protein [Clostridium sp.]
MSIEKLIPVAEQMDELIAAVKGLSKGSTEEALDATFQSILDGTNTTKVFRQWWPLSETETNTRFERLSRFATMLASAWAGKKYTLQYFDPSVSTSPVMTPVDDLTGKSAAQLCTEITKPVTDWADEDPMTWYVRANALSLADGNMNILAVEGVDSDFDITGETAPVYTFSVALFIKKWAEGGYYYKSWATVNKGGYRPYAGDVGLDNKKRALTWHPTFAGSLNSGGGMTSGAGLKPLISTSAANGLVAARKTTAYEGLWNDADAIWVLDMWQLRHFNLENSGICEGCQSYNFTYTNAVAETGVNRVLLTAAQAANLQVGSNISIAATDRANVFTILGKEVVTVDGTEYTAVNVDGASFDTTTATKVCTMPWNSGNTENLPGHKDGACHSLTAGQNPLRVMGVEMMTGAYEIGLDPLYQVSNLNSEVSPVQTDFEVYECRDSENLASSITSDYVDTGIGMTDIKYTWNYPIEYVDTDKAVLFPKTFGGSTSVGYKSGFRGAASAGVRCPWRYGTLYHGANAGLACESGYNAPSSADWSGRPRLCGSGKKRGEWAGA